MSQSAAGRWWDWLRTPVGFGVVALAVLALVVREWFAGGSGEERAPTSPFPPPGSR